MSNPWSPPGVNPPGFNPPRWDPGGDSGSGGPVVSDPTIGAPVALPAPTASSIDFKTIADKFNEGLPRSPMYEFSGGRKFYNPDDL
jgi:hypothetical protein